MYYHYLPLLIFLFPLDHLPECPRYNFMAKDNHIHLSFTEIDYKLRYSYWSKNICQRIYEMFGMPKHFVDLFFSN